MTLASKKIYLDYNATTPVASEVVEAMLPYLSGDEAFGNPHRAHWAGIPAKQAVMKAREQVAQLIGADPDEIVFTSCGSESVNHAIKGTFLPYFKSGVRNHVITSQIEHPASKMACRFLEDYLGARLTEIPVDENCVIDVEAIRKATTPNTALINIMHANHEVGTIQPADEIYEIAKENDVIYHIDAVCSVGKNIVDVKKLGCDLLSLSGHKYYAPKGIAALYVSKKMGQGLPDLDADSKFESLISGMLSKGDYRAGTPNVPSIVGFGKASEMAYTWNTADNRKALANKRDFMWSQLKETFSEKVVLNAHTDPEKRICNSLNVSFPGFNANEILSSLEHVAASAGPKTEEIIRKMGRSSEVATGAIRFSLGKMTTQQELIDTVDYLKIAIDGSTHT